LRRHQWIVYVKESFMLRKLSCAYAAGTIGALVGCLALWLLGREGFSSWLGITLQPRLTSTWLIVNLFWGGLFGVPLALPILENRVAMRGLLAALLAAAYTLLIYYPRLGRGPLATGYGALTPVLLAALFALWGLIAAVWYRQAR
jgi:hypothetical protein